MPRPNLRRADFVAMTVTSLNEPGRVRKHRYLSQGRNPPVGGVHEPASCILSDLQLCALAATRTLAVDDSLQDISTLMARVCA